MNRAAALLLAALVTGCSTAPLQPVEPGVYLDANYTPAQLRSLYAARHGDPGGPVGAFTDFEQTPDGWRCRIYAPKVERPADRACTVQHETVWHCRPGLAHAAGYGAAAYLGSVRHAAGYDSHPVYEPDGSGRLYRGC